jgi:hypothetical protein
MGVKRTYSSFVYFSGPVPKAFGMGRKWEASEKKCAVFGKEVRRFEKLLPPKNDHSAQKIIDYQ